MLSTFYILPPPPAFLSSLIHLSTMNCFLLTGENIDKNGLTTHSLSHHFTNASRLGFLNLFLRKKGAHAPI